MYRRIEFHSLLCELLGSSNVYFQPPESIKMKYPAIVYSLNDIDTEHANNGVYLYTKQYSVTLVSKEPDSPVIDKLALLPMSMFNRSYVADNLNHTVFSIYY